MKVYSEISGVSARKLPQWNKAIVNSTPGLYALEPEMERSVSIPNAMETDKKRFSSKPYYQHYYLLMNTSPSNDDVLHKLHKTGKISRSRWRTAHFAERINMGNCLSVKFQIVMWAMQNSRRNGNVPLQAISIKVSGNNCDVTSSNIFNSIKFYLRGTQRVFFGHCRAPFEMLLYGWKHENQTQKWECYDKDQWQRQNLHQNCKRRRYTVRQGTMRPVFRSRWRKSLSIHLVRLLAIGGSPSNKSISDDIHREHNHCWVYIKTTTKESDNRQAVKLPRSAQHNQDGEKEADKQGVGTTSVGKSQLV